MTGITITCAHCGAATDFDAAVQDMPMDHFRCGSCAKVWKRCHGKPKRLDDGFVLPGSVRIKEVKACVRQTELVRNLPGVRA